ncbi:MAG: glucose-1-phosphate thymidylyltransferase [Acidimicrobiaceae bacterium]|nr:glucose-1-phosphate thymidylyltransferase [Acidimicrobiaceae bacterium]
MKGLILAGGSGRRLRPLTHTSAKQLVPIANVPILHYVVADLVGVGITDIGIVVGDTAAEVMASIGDGSRWGAKVTYIAQDRPLGLAHAVVVAGPFLGDEPFAMYLGDNMFEDSLDGVVDGFDGCSAARLLLARVDDPSAFGVADVAPDGTIVGLAEKPEEPASDLALVGVYLFGPRIHEAVRAIEPSARGELEITDAIQWLLDAGEVVEHRVLEGWWIDTGKKDPLLECNRLVLDRLGGDGVVVDGDAEVVDSTLVGPVVVAAGARISGSTVGPYVAVGARCAIEGSTVEHSVLMDGAVVSDLDRLTGSVLGRSAEVTGSRGDQVDLSVLLGDHSVVDARSSEGGTGG